jgi:hypothetical protein
VVSALYDLLQLGQADSVIAFGVCPITLGGASISDLIAQEKRGAAMALYSMGPLMGTT